MGPATSEMEIFVKIFNGIKPFTIVIKLSILYVAGVLDPSLFFVTSFEHLFVSWDNREKHTLCKASLSCSGK